MTSAIYIGIVALAFALAVIASELRKLASARFASSSDEFFAKAEQLISSSEQLPPEIISTLVSQGEILTSLSQCKAFSKHAIRKQLLIIPPDGEFPEAISKLNKARLDLLVSTLVEFYMAVMSVRTLDLFLYTRALKRAGFIEQKPPQKPSSRKLIEQRIFMQLAAKSSAKFA